MSKSAHALDKAVRSKPFQLFLIAGRLFLGAMFLYAGITKILDPAGFSLAVYNYHILPAQLVNITAIILPWVEAVAGASLVLGLWARGGALIVAALLLVFITALGFNLFRGLDIACGCFSTSASAETITWWYLLRDSLLLVLALLVLLYEQGLFSLQGRPFLLKTSRPLHRRDL